MPTLSYVAIKGLGEVSRLLFHYAGVEFEDKRYDLHHFQTIKHSFPNCQVPLLEIDGHKISQSGAIVRFLANRFGLAGKDEFERARADEIYGVVYDRMREHYPYHIFRLFNPGQDNETLYKDHFAPSVQKALPFYEQLVQEANEQGGFVLKSGLSYADFMLAVHLSIYFSLDPKLKSEHPNLVAFAEKIHSVSPAIKDYVSKRPNTLV
ncbi:Glutathione S-transferase-1 [Aphelenchoides besseyi]|nr:Glutathione S-transferase-1 [Aphelenchoides besseyi]KAI6216526.1 Glutathione S-transferase-1 [Aphelenchoides besseyi]